MPQSSIFENNRTQAVRLPLETRFDSSIKKVNVRVKGKERILCPTTNTWDSFFIDGPDVSEDFMAERANQSQGEREPL